MRHRNPNRRQGGQSALRQQIGGKMSVSKRKELGRRQKRYLGNQFHRQSVVLSADVGIVLSGLRSDDVV